MNRPLTDRERVVTTPTTTLEGPIAALRERAIELISDIAGALATEGIDAPDDVKRLRDVAQDLRNLFFIVAVIGEFNAGKSSFVNAILGEKLLPMGITPTTEFIELIRYNDVPDRTPTIRDGTLREWGHPNTGAPGVAIVDTPGTGSVFQRHEKTAKEFLHRSDLVIFLISAKHAFAETERIYLELAKHYGKKIILVVNQVDLLKASEQAEVRRFIQSQVKETLEIEPLLFMVSAREALDAIGKESPTADAGNVGAVKAHLRGVYSEAPPAKQKLIAQLDTANRIIQNHHDGAHDKAQLVSADLTKVQDVKKELEQQSIGLETRMKEAGAEIDTVLQGVRRRGLDFIDANLSVRKIGRGLDREKMQQEFEEVVIGRSLRDIGDATEGYINAVVDQSRLYWRSVVDRLNRIQDLMEQEAGGLDKGIYAEQRESLQNAIRIAEAELKSYSSGEVVATMKNSFDANIGNFQGLALMSVGGLAVAIIAFLTPGAAGTLLSGAAAGPFAPFVFVVGGAVALVAGIPAVQSIRRMTKQAKDQFNGRIDELIKNYHQALDDLTKRERNRLNQYGNQVLTPVFSRLGVLAQRYENQQLKLEKLQREIKDLRTRIEDLK
jgi:small GTP-binding protein